MSTETSSSLKSVLSLSSTNYEPWRVGLSMAASWSWGASLATGIGILLTMGQAGFWIWAVFNIIAIPLFGAMFQKFEEYQYLLKFWPALLFMGYIQLGTFFINSQAIFEVANGGVDLAGFQLLGNTAATALAMGVGFFFIGLIHKYGLPGSISTDLYQYIVQLVGCLLIIGLALVWNIEGATVPASSPGQMTTALWLGIGLLGGPMFGAQQWQRIREVDEDKQARAGLWGGLFFGVYLVAVYFVGILLGSGSAVLSAILLITVLGVTTSTIDSATAALQMLLGNRTAGTAVAALAVVAWPAVQSLGIVALFGYIFRISAVLFLVFTAAIILAEYTSFSIAPFATADIIDDEPTGSVAGPADD